MEDDWLVVGKGNTNTPPVSTAVSIRSVTLDDNKSYVCKCAHKECRGLELCVIKVRAEIPCYYEYRQAGTCPFGARCYFKHKPDKTPRQPTD